MGIGILEFIIVIGIFIGLIAVLVIAGVALFRNKGVALIVGSGLLLLLGFAFLASFYLSVQRAPVERGQIAGVQEAIPPQPRDRTLTELEAAEITGSGKSLDVTGDDAVEHDAIEHGEEDRVAAAQQQEREAELAAERPRWIRDGAQVLTREDVEQAEEGNRTVPDIFIVQSGLWSTPEEAVSEAEALARQLVHGKARNVFSPQYDDRSIRLGMQKFDQLKMRTFTETRMVQLTSDVETEMTRAFLEVISTPEELHAFTPVVRHYAAQKRLEISAAVLVAIVLAAVLISLVIDRGKRSTGQPAA